VNFLKEISQKISQIIREESVQKPITAMNNYGNEKYFSNKY
jgi:hypothetical protein